MDETGPMPDWSALIISVLAVAVLALLLRWAYGGRRASLIARHAKAGAADDYGLMVAIASPGTFIDGEVSRQRLVTAGIKAQLVTTIDGPRLMVLRDDEVTARRVLAG